MTKRNKPFEVEKSFGLGVLLKLTKKNIPGLEISTTGNKFTSPSTLTEVNDAVHRTMKTHNIRLKLK